MAILTKDEIKKIDNSVSMGGYSIKYMLEKLNETMSKKLGITNFYTESECFHIVELKMLNDAFDLLIKRLE